MQHKPWTHLNYKIKLFCILPLYGHKETQTKREWRILGIPVWTIKKRHHNSLTRNYYALGCLRMMKISQKVK